MPRKAKSEMELNPAEDTQPIKVLKRPEAKSKAKKATGPKPNVRCETLANVKVGKGEFVPPGTELELDHKNFTILRKQGAVKRIEDD